jgi:hypothetical protein
MFGRLKFLNALTSLESVRFMKAVRSCPVVHLLLEGQNFVLQSKQTVQRFNEFRDNFWIMRRRVPARLTDRVENYFTICRLGLFRYIPVPNSYRFGNVKFSSFLPYTTLTHFIDQKIIKSSTALLSKCWPRTRKRKDKL